MRKHETDYQVYVGLKKSWCNDCGDVTFFCLPQNCQPASTIQKNFVEILSKWFQNFS